MKKFFADLVKRLSSRKFLLAVSAAAAFFAEEQYAEAVAVIVTYIGSEGAADAVGRYQSVKANGMKQIYDDSRAWGDDVEIDDSQIQPGNTDVPM